MVPLSRAIGRKRALEMLLTGEPISAATALEWGLVNRVVPKSDLDAVKRIYKHVHDQEQRYELNLYVVGEEDQPEPGEQTTQADAAGSHLPEERSPNK